MINRRWDSVILIVGFLALGCEEHIDRVPRRFTEISITSKPEEIQVPTAVWEEVELVYNDRSDKVRKNLQSADIPKAFFPIKVSLIEKSKGVLGGHNYRISLPEGGGRIDLSNFVHEGRGTFYVHFQNDLEIQNGDVAPRVFFISNSHERTIDDQIWGTGCWRAFDITSFHDSQMRQKGYVVNATDQRYVSLLAGVFVFSAKVGGTLMLSQVSFGDSRYPHLQCH